jgi:hypothetical protein
LQAQAKLDALHALASAGRIRDFCAAFVPTDLSAEDAAHFAGGLETDAERCAPRLAPVLALALLRTHPHACVLLSACRADAQIHAAGRASPRRSACSPPATACAKSSATRHGGSARMHCFSHAHSGLAAAERAARAPCAAR